MQIVPRIGPTTRSARLSFPIVPTGSRDAWGCLAAEQTRRTKPSLLQEDGDARVGELVVSSVDRNLYDSHPEHHLRPGLHWFELPAYRAELVSREPGLRLHRVGSGLIFGRSS